MFRVFLCSSARSTRVPTCAGLLGLLLLAAGCTGIADLERTSEFQDPYSQGNYAGAVATLQRPSISPFSTGGKDGLNYDKENLLTSLQVGSALRAMGSYETSQTAFDSAEKQLMWTADEISDLGEFLEAPLTIVGNDLITSYHGYIYEGVLINTYKAMNWLDLGNEARARVEFNRADQRQANAVYQLAAKVRALAEEEANEATDRERESRRIDQTLAEVKNPNGEIGRRLAAVQALGEYKDLRNPFTDWLHGVFRLATGEANRASDLFRNAVVLDGKRNSHVLADFRLAEKTANTIGGARRRVWIVHEDGIGPHLKEFRFDLPVFARSGPIYSGIAVPEFVAGTPAFGSIGVEAGGVTYRTEPLLNVDRYAATEFRAGYDTIIAKAVASAVVKVVAQIAAQQVARRSDSVFADLAMVITTVGAAVTTRADTRMWQALPKSINVASVPWPADGNIRITAGSRSNPKEIQLPSAAFVVVTVKTVSAGAPPIYHVAAIGNNGAVSSQMIAPKVRSVAAIDEETDMPAIRLAVMRSAEAPKLVHAGYIETANGYATGTASNGTAVAHSTAKHSTAIPNWWKPHVSVESTLKNEGLQQLAITRSLNAGGFVRVVGEFFNNSDRKLSAMYRFTWLDGAGQPVDSILGNWQVVHALPSTHARVYGTAPRDNIDGFHLELVSASDEPSPRNNTHAEE